MFNRHALCRYCDSKEKQADANPTSLSDAHKTNKGCGKCHSISPLRLYLKHHWLILMLPGVMQEFVDHSKTLSKISDM